MLAAVSSVLAEPIIPMRIRVRGAPSMEIIESATTKTETAGPMATTPRVFRQVRTSGPVKIPVRKIYLLAIA